MFCIVTAVTAVIAYDPRLVTVLISACIPAPPEESDPAIIRILEFNRGQIFYDSVELSQLSLDWLKSNLTYLPQEPKFIDGTLLDNLLGLTEIKKDKMNEILKAVDLIDFVNSDPYGIKMPMPNRGENLPIAAHAGHKRFSARLECPL